MTIAQIKDLFQTGKIPTQADFENLINKIPNSELTWGRDNTLKLLVILFLLQKLTLIVIHQNLIYKINLL